MKSVLLGVGVVLLPAVASAAVWTGSLYERISTSTDPLYSPGEVLTGRFQYRSTLPGPDGTFDVAQPGSNRPYATLTGTLFTGVDGGGYVPLQAAPYANNHITVFDGVVTAFVYQDETGGNAYVGGPGPSDPFTFAFYPLSGSDSSYAITGTVSFSDPADPPARVPDGGATLVLLGVGLLCAGAGRRFCAN